MLACRHPSVVQPNLTVCEVGQHLGLAGMLAESYLANLGTVAACHLGMVANQLAQRVWTTQLVAPI